MRKGKLKYKNLLATIFLSISFLSLIPSQAFAGCTDQILPCGDLDGDGQVTGSEMCNLCHVFELFNNIIVFILTCLAPVVASLLLVVGGFYFFVAGPSPQNVTRAKLIIWATVIGVVIIFVSWVFLNTLLTSIGVATWSGLDPTSADPWWRINCSVP